MSEVSVADNEPAWLSDRGIYYEPQPLEVAIPELSVDRVAQMLFESFRHSQGIVSAQQYIFDYLALRFGYSYESFAQHRPAVPKVKERVAHILGSKVHPAGKGGENEVSIMWTRLLKSLRDNHKLEGDQPGLLAMSLRGLLEYIIDKEEEIFFNRPNGRHKLDPSSSYPSLDSYHSYFVDHSVLGHPTKVPEYTQMYKDLAGFINFIIMQPNWGATLEASLVDGAKRITQEYFAYHPEKVNTLPDEWRFLLTE